ncbi:MAG: hypothetical protein JNM88_03785 [Chitinophagaceae bacterium]|nr:hypothetical protein [Chitinophagaceae bacterium]
MSDSHADRYITKLLIGLGSLVTFVFVLYFSIVEGRAQQGDWYYWAIVAAFLLCGGVFFCVSAIAHKIKSDFSRRAKQREAQRERADR